MFIGEVADEKELSDVPSVSYQYYFDHIKPKPETKKKGFVCKICGYVYEGDELPPDFICPICKHGVEAFEPIK
jgi:rubrerythrin